MTVFFLLAMEYCALQVCSYYGCVVVCNKQRFEHLSEFAFEMQDVSRFFSKPLHIFCYIIEGSKKVHA